MNILVACEFSGVVRRAFEAKGHTVTSCDLESAEDGSKNHYKGPVEDLLVNAKQYDLMIAHPPCTYLCLSGVQHLTWTNQERWKLMREARDFFNMLLKQPIEKICIENPKMHGYAQSDIPGHNQVIQPWQFGHGDRKITWLWLKGLKSLKSTNVVSGRSDRIHNGISAGKNRGRERSRTYPGIGAAMAEQWG